jgi:DNA polymerase-4
LTDVRALHAEVAVYRKILHLDLDAFFCAVEELRDPSLRGKPFAVGGRPEQRGVVASCSYAARCFDVRSAMPTARALRLCPQLLLVSGHYDAYREASQQVMQRAHALTPLVEQLSIDEAFLDVSDLPEPGEAIAQALQAGINRDLQLPCSLGVATNKLVAKIANNVGKSAQRRDVAPNAITVVAPGREADFLAPLAVAELWGVGPKTAGRLAELGIRTIGDLARHPESELVRRFGRHGHYLPLMARGHDDSPVISEHEAKSISQETTFARDVSDCAVLRQSLRGLAERVGRRLRRHGLCGTTVKIKLRWSDFTTLTRQTTLEQPTDLDSVICETAAQLFDKTWLPGKPVRLLGVGVSGFAANAYQLQLWADRRLERSRSLQATLDTVRERFGSRAILRASELERGNGPEDE